MYIVGIPLDCGHRLVTTIATIRTNRSGLWYCWECKTGNHVETLETHENKPLDQTTRRTSTRGNPPTLAAMPQP